MMKKLVILLVCCVMTTLLLIACGSPGSGAGAATDQVHMSNANFVQPSITIKKGESVTLIADTFIAHNIANGTWANGTPTPAREPGAPAIDNMPIAGNASGTIGPFNSVGTFKLYCTVHPNMNLIVTVQ